MTRRNKPIGYRSKPSALIAMVHGHYYSIAKLAFLYMTGNFPVGRILRKDGDNRNDRWDNLYDTEKIKGELTHDLLLRLISYDPETGEVTKMGKTDWCKQKHGHMLVSVGGVHYKAHRLAWFYMTGAWPKNHIDHIDGNPTNNRWDNLRDVTRSQNLRNQHRTKRACCGVYKRKNRWVVALREGGLLRHYGSFVTLDDAIAKSQQVRAVRDADIQVQ
jgi:hypothetical protein